MRKWAPIFAVLFCLAVDANADKLCLKTTVNKNTFKVTTQSAVAARCPAGYTAIADTSSFTGPPGIVNLAACRTVANNCSFAAGSNSCSATCSNSEFILQQSVVLSGCGLSHTEVFTSYFTNGLAFGLTSYSTGNCSYTHSVDVVCCPIS